MQIIQSQLNLLYNTNINLAGAVIMGVGSVLFSIPHFSGETNAGILVDNKTNDNICRLVSVRESDMGLGRFGHQFSKLPNPALSGTPNNLRYVPLRLGLGCRLCGHQLGHIL